MQHHGRSHSRSCFDGKQAFPDLSDLLLPISVLFRHHLRSLASFSFCHLHHPPAIPPSRASSHAVSEVPGGDICVYLETLWSRQISVQQVLEPKHPCTTSLTRSQRELSPRSPVLEPQGCPSCQSRQTQDTTHSRSRRRPDVTTTQPTPFRLAGLAEPLPAPREQSENLCPRVSTKGCTERNALTRTRQQHRTPSLLTPHSLSTAAQTL
ncbi:hypothetical protein BDP81DRAFT_105809 [Colletotrichum phormii]|uniref:Uncharacterized protein n=1 Tax=Colletotrichum phormii TaxID=359342 RepID=A0AAI9ZHF3_9PEZI|nr:uncharacterized protein BDP81DRAFT_105809 [Colletotrichum phormii]KAK1624653.1 hypothetical protein BDP81DRAFT_105809 [Colletotrichum phormii]